MHEPNTAPREHRRSLWCRSSERRRASVWPTVRHAAERELDSILCDDEYAVGAPDETGVARLASRNPPTSVAEAPREIKTVENPSTKKMELMNAFFINSADLRYQPTIQSPDSRSLPEH